MQGSDLRRPDDETVVVEKLDVDTGMRTTDRSDLVRVGFGVGRRPADHLTDLGLAVAVQHEDTEAVSEAPGLERLTGAR